MHDRRQRVPHIVQPHDRNLCLPAQHREPVTVSLRPDRKPHRVHKRVAGLGVRGTMLEPVSGLMLRKQFHWPESRPWTRGEMADEIGRLTDTPTFAVLDGINAACGDHGWDASTNSAVGEYRSTFVTPLTEVGCTVLSLGHPVKAPSRQGEAYSYGAAAWLNHVDGIGYRLKASSEPLTPGGIGHSALSIVKDRYGDVMRHGIKNDDDKDLPWYFVGSFYVDDTYTVQVMVGEKLWQHMKVTTPSKNGGDKLDKYDQHGQRVTAFLLTQPGWSFKSQNDLETKMRRRPGRTPHRHARHARTATAERPPRLARGGRQETPPRPALGRLREHPRGAG